MANGVQWSTLYLGNLTEMDTNERTFSVETAKPLLKTFGGKGEDALSHNVVDVTTNAGHDSVIATDNTHSSDSVEYDLGDGPIKAAVDSVIALKGEVTFQDGSTLSSYFGVFQADNGDSFMMVLDSQPQLASQAIDSVTFKGVFNSNYSGLYQNNKDDNKFVCFGPGTRLETPLGLRRADQLRPGDRLMTLDHGPLPIRWIAKRRVRFDPDDPAAQPILVRRGAMGKALPRRNLFLSPDHRVLVETQPGFALHEPGGALAPAKALTRLAAIRPARGRRAITWFSFLLEDHAVIFAEGMAVESLFPGPEVWARLRGPEKSQWMALAREGRVTGALPARLMLTAREARAGLDTGYITLPTTQPRPAAWSARNRRAPVVAMRTRA